MKFATATAVAMSALLSAQTPGDLVTREVYLMGTRATLAVRTNSRTAGLQTLEAAVLELERTEAELSTWRETSDISALNRQPIGSPWRASSPAQCRMFAEIWEWHSASDGAFDPAIGALMAAWDVHGDGAIPAPTAQAMARQRSGLRHLRFDAATCTITRTADAAMDVGAFGKGEALDRAARVMGGEAWMIDLGGQVTVGGTAADWPIDVAHPSDRSRAHLQLRLQSGSLSTSGGSERDTRVSGRRVGHIFDPRTAEPAGFDGSVTVWHQRGLTADILSTVLYVMGPERGLRWAERHGVAALYLIPEGGSVRAATTPAFRTAAGVTFSERE